MTLLLACSAALLAGFVDAVAAGGGLSQLPALLAAVAAYAMRRKDPGDAPTDPRIAGWAGGALIGGALGLCDGLFGPGTGTFLLVAFASAGQVRRDLAHPMAGDNVAGALLGSRRAPRAGRVAHRSRALLVRLTRDALHA